MSEYFCEGNSGAKTREWTRSHPNDDLGDLLSRTTCDLDRTFNETRQRLAVFGRTVVTASKEWNRAIEEPY
jgi:hypothetical protein